MASKRLSELTRAPQSDEKQSGGRNTTEELNPEYGAYIQLAGRKYN